MPQPLLSGESEYIEADGPVDLETRVRDLERHVAHIESAQAQTKRDAVIILLNLLNAALEQVASGKLDIASTEASHASSDARWDAIKSRLPRRHAEAVDILLLHGSMNRTQLAAAMKMDYSNCTKNVIGVLMRQGIIVSNGRDLTLKQL